MAKNPDHVRTVTAAQIQAACRILGFDPRDVATMYLEHGSGVVRVIDRSHDPHLPPTFRDVALRVAP